MESKGRSGAHGSGIRRPVGRHTSPDVSERLRRSFQRATRQGHRLRELARGTRESLGLTRPRVSSWSVAQHLEHLALSNQLMLDLIDEILAGEATIGPQGPSLIGRLVLFTGWIPRGKGKAPQAALPRGVSESRLLELIIDAGRRIDRLGGRLDEIEHATGRRPHFAFGGLTAGQWLRVIEVHNRHHLEIIDDILSGRGRKRSRPS